MRSNAGRKASSRPYVIGSPQANVAEPFAIAVSRQQRPPRLADRGQRPGRTDPAHPTRWPAHSLHQLEFRPAGQPRRRPSRKSAVTRHSSVRPVRSGSTAPRNWRNAVVGGLRRPRCPSFVSDALVDEIGEALTDCSAADETHGHLVASLTEEALASPQHNRIDR
jgi:hypothetical protein